MAMEFLAFDDQFIPDLAADEQNENFFAFHIIQDAQISRSKFARKDSGAVV